MQRVLLAAVLMSGGCAHAQLRDAADEMIRIERGTAAVVEGVVQFKTVVKDDCVAQQLAEEAARARCVEKAVRALEISEVGVTAVRAALVSFWELYAQLKAQDATEGRLKPSQLLEVFEHSARVVKAYVELVNAVKEAKQ